MPLRDRSTMIYGTATEGDLLVRLQGHLAEVNKRTGQSLKPQSAPPGQRPKAYVNQGRWVADCPNCNGGIAVSMTDATGACFDCGSIYVINKPNANQIARAEFLLSVRLLDRNRNWDRHRDEDLDDLAAQNIANGLDAGEGV